eukprot:Hpha_TRINITY_DN23268_c0_g1::TRINITY_DN23268_c0_g1_i1::g.30169::m.30169/K04043/dnaK, HSPA9; molecular chaperone DnaK
MRIVCMLAARSQSCLLVAPRTVAFKQRRSSVADRGQPSMATQVGGRGDTKQWIDDSGDVLPPSVHWGSHEFKVPKYDYSSKRYAESTHIGIDLGTTNSCCSRMEGSLPVVVPNLQGKKTTPTAINLSGNKQRHFGQEAYRTAMASPTSTMLSGKRLLGKALWDRRVPRQVYEETMRLVQTDAGIAIRLPQVKVKGEEKNKKPDVEYPVVHIMGMFLRHLKVTSEHQLEKNVDSCVIAVPAHFNDAQRKATEDAAVAAGFDVLEIIDEPSAAALAYSVVVKDARFGQKDLANLVVFDLGGGTFDMAVLQMDFKAQRNEVLATGGDDLLGGDDFDRSVRDYWSAELTAQGLDIDKDFSTAKQLDRAAEECKIHLDQNEDFRHTFRVPPTNGFRMIPVHLSMSRFEYEELIEPLLQRLRGVITDVMERSGLRPEDIDDILLVGEMTRTPAILDVMRDVFKQEPLHSDVASPGTVVAMGAAIRAEMIVRMLDGADAEGLPRITFDENSIQYEKQLTYSDLLQYRLKKWAKKKYEDWSERRRRREHGGERRARQKMEDGLTDEQIEGISREIVQMEMNMNQVAMCAKVVDEAEKLLIDITNWKEPRRGFRDPDLDEHVEVLKFWLKIARDQGAGEEQLSQAVWELQYYFEELAGGAGTASVEDVVKDANALDNLNIGKPGEAIHVYHRQR